MKKFVPLIYLLFLTTPELWAQGHEVKLPLRNNPALRGEARQVMQRFHAYGKTGSSTGLFPFIDWFSNKEAYLTDSLWVKGHTTKGTKCAVFNAQDSAGQTYGGNNFDACDSLTSNYVDLSLNKGEIYIYFKYSTGSTWNPGDSLVIQFKTGSGNYRTIWTSPDAPVTFSDIIVPVTSIGDYLSVSFNVKIISYGPRNLTNTEDFILHDFALTDKWILPFYENFLINDQVHHQPSPENWIQRQVKTADKLIETGFGLSNYVVFDSYDENGEVYHQSNGLQGFTDTLMSNLINLENFKVSDSVYLRFFSKAFPAAGITDSLILELKDKNGLWTRVWQTSGLNQSGWIRAATQVNYSKWRGINFQFRIISKGTYAADDTLQFGIAGVHLGRKLGLPFIDDFSKSTLYPDQNLWNSRSTYINNDFPIRPPSINVATFDALDQYGNAYTHFSGYCDTLGSVALNLSKLTPADTGVYLTFFIEPNGFGEMPNASDSLVLEFKRSSTGQGGFVQVWRGARNNYNPLKFTPVAVKIDTVFFHDDFQFRLMNRSSNGGNLNHWHVDYVRLDKSGLRSTTSYYDIAVSKTQGSLLTPYASMPYTHFAVNPDNYLKTSQQIIIFNNDTIAKPAAYSREVFDPSGTRIDSTGNITGFVIKDTTVTINKKVNLNWSPTNDSTVFTSRFNASTQGNGDYIPFNDSLTIKTVFANYYAYDDGTAESGYAVQNATGSVALQYNLAKADSIYGVSMFFNQGPTDVSQRTFDLVIWKEINTNGNGTGQTEIMRYSLISPVYTNKRNGFYFYQFTEPLFLPAGKFYLGWSQNQIFDLNVGIDENFEINGDRVNPNMNYFLDDQGLWTQTSLTGALMLRPVIGKWIDPPAGITTLQKAKELNVNVYPNPATDLLMIASETHQPFYAEIRDITGRVIYAHSNVTTEIRLPACNAGLYLLRLTDPDGKSVVKKIIIQP